MLHLTPSKNTKHTNQNTKNAIPMKNSANQNTRYLHYGFTLFCREAICGSRRALLRNICCHIFWVVAFVCLLRELFALLYLPVALCCIDHVIVIWSKQNDSCVKLSKISKSRGTCVPLVKHYSIKSLCRT